MLGNYKRNRPGNDKLQQNLHVEQSSLSNNDGTWDLKK